MTERPLQPLKSQRRKFWEWFGWYFNGCYWFPPIVGEHSVEMLPFINMNNLTKYAIAPLKARNKWTITLESLVCYPHHYLVTIADSLNPHLENYHGKSEDLALAVFWAIWEMIEKEES